MTLTAARYASVEWAGVRLVVFAIDRAPELLQLENKIVDAVQPFAVNGGTADAFARAPGEEINADTINTWRLSFLHPRERSICRT